MSKSNPFEARITERLVSERLAGNQPVLTLEEVALLGGDVDEDGQIDRFGPTVSALMDDFGAGIIPEETSGPRVTRRDLSEEESAAIIRAYDDKVADRRNEKRYYALTDQYAAAIEAEQKRYDVDAHTALGYLVNDSAIRLRAAGKADEADAEIAAWRWGKAQQKAPPQTIQQRVADTLAEQVTD